MTKNVSVPEGYKKTELGMIPEEWNIGTLENIAEINPKTNVSHFEENTTVTFLPMQNVGVNGKILKYETRKYNDVKKGYTCFAEKDVLFAKITPCMENGKGALATNLENKVGFGSTEYHVLRSKQNGSPEFTFYITKWEKFRKEAEKYMTGSAGQRRVSKNLFFSYKIPIPTFPEQQKIASILSKVDEQIEQTEQIIEKTEILKKGLMQKLLTKGIGHTKFKKTELGEIPEEWDIKGLTKVFNIIDYRGRTPPFSENGIPYIGADNIKDARIVFNKRRYVSEETYTGYMTRGIPNPDDILFTTEAPLGNVAQVPEYKFCFAQRVVVFQCKNDFSPLFFMYLLKNKIMQKQFLDWATGTTVTGISSKNMKFIKLYYPKNIQEQKKIGQVLESVDKYIDSEKENLLSLQELKKGLMQDLLTGKVRVCV